METWTFHTVGVRAEELPHQIVKGFDGEYVGYETVLFGGAGSPGVWGRAAAFLGRSGQALFSTGETRIQVYVDDPCTVWRGNACGPILEQSDFVTVVVGRRSRDLLEEAADWKAGKVYWRPGPARGEGGRDHSARQVHCGVAGGGRADTAGSSCSYWQAQEARGQG